MSLYATSEDVEKWLEPILDKEDIKNYTVTIEGYTEKGEGFLGDITFVHVSGTSKSTNEAIEFSFVLKVGKRSKQLRNTFPIRTAFENEVFWYDEVIPTFKRFQEEKGIKEPFDNFPKCFGTLVTEDLEVLVLQNLRRVNYELHNKKRPMSFKHVTSVVKAYGKLHALSYALRDQKPDIFVKWTNKLKDVWADTTFDAKSQSAVYDDIIEVAKEVEDWRVVETAKILSKEIASQGKLTQPDDPFSVILHGDCWNNNFMFKYNGSQRKKPSDVVLLDFQLSRAASPVLDLSYFLFTCLSPEDLGRFDEINDIYYSSFSEFVTELGSDPEKVFPFDELSRQWKKFGKYGLLIMPGIVRIVLSEKDEVPDLTETAEAGRDVFKDFAYKVRNFDEYGRRTLGVLRLAREKGLVTVS